ncbi:MAG: hypothetical protein ACREF1_09950, partial [Acetobacteraceae bacterium]
MVETCGEPPSLARPNDMTLNRSRIAHGQLIARDLSEWQHDPSTDEDMMSTGCGQEHGENQRRRILLIE